MSSDRRKTPVHLGGFAAPEELRRALEAADLLVETSPTAAAAAEQIGREVERGGTVAAVVLLPGAGDGVVAAARKIRSAAPTTQLIFLADWQQRSALQPELRAADLGHGWSFASPDPARLVETVRDAMATSGHRRLVRTTLDRGDVRVSSAQLSAQRVRKLAISDALLAAILRDAVDAIIATDERGRIVSANPAAGALLGYESGLQNVSISEVMPDVTDLGALAGKAASMSARCREGGEVPVDVTVSRVVVGSSPAGFAIIARDARPRLAAEDELRRQAELTSTIVNGIAEGVYVIDAFGNLLFMNPAAEEMLGWKFSDLVPRNIHDTIHAQNADGEHLAAVDCPLLQAIRSGIPLRSDQVFTRKDGTLLPVACAVTPVRLNGEVIGGVFNFHDLSPFQKIQAELRAEKETLVQMNRAKDDFLATVSHELRTPLTAILGWLQLVTRGNVEAAELNEALEAIETSARAQSKIVNDLLDVSRTISGKLHLAMAEIDLNDVVSAAVGTVRPAADAKRIKLEVVQSREKVVVCGDPGRLNQIVWNLVTNAIKFTPEGGSVTVEVHPDHARVRLIVRDNGVGIAAEMLPIVFEKYRQAEAGAPHGGLGLGLAIVRTLVERHDGAVSIESELGRGTTVTVDLPRYVAGTDCDAAPG